MTTRTTPTLPTVLPAFAKSVGAALVFSSIAACAPNSGGQVGEEGFKCEATETTVLAPSDATVLGFTAEAAFEVVRGANAASLTWADDVGTQLSFSVGDALAMRYEDREWRDEEGNRDASEFSLGTCDDAIVIEALASVSTADGRLDEMWPVDLVAVSENDVRATGVFEVENGTLEIAAFAPEGEFSDVVGLFDIQFAPGGLSGHLDGQAEAQSGEDVSTTYFAIGEF